MRLLSVFPFLGILIVAVALAEHSKSRIACAIPAAMFSFALLPYLTGLLGSLLPGLFACYAIILASTAYLAVRIKQKRLDWKRLTAPSLIFFIAVYVFGLIVHRHETLIGWDESAHWILALRNSFALNRFAAVAESSARYKTYPPILAMYHYFFTKTAIVYANTTVRMSVTVLTAGLFAPLLTPWDASTGPNRFWAVFADVLLFAFPFAYFKNAYFGTQVDLIQRLVLACILFTYFLSDRPRLRLLTAFLGLAFLTLTKDSGLILALIAAFIMAFDLLLQCLKAGAGQGKRQRLLHYTLLALGLLALPVLVKLSWTAFLRFTGVVEEAGDQLDYWMIDYVKSILSGRFRTDYAHDYRMAGFVQFWRSVLYDANFHENTRFWLFGVSVPYSVKLAVSAVLMALAARCAEEPKRMRTAFALLFLGNLVWLLGISILYLCRFTEEENAVLSSVSRYLGTGLVAMDAFSLAILFRKLAVSLSANAGMARVKRILAAGVGAALILPSLSVLFSDAAYENYKGRALLCLGETEYDREYDAYTTELSRLGAYLTREDAVLIVAPLHDQSELWYRHVLTPLSRVSFLSADALTVEQIAAHTKVYLFADVDTSHLADRLDGITLTGGALYEVVQQDGRDILLRIL